MGKLNRQRAAVKKREVAADKRPKHQELLTPPKEPPLSERVRQLEQRTQFGNGGGS